MFQCNTLTLYIKESKSGHWGVCKVYKAQDCHTRKLSSTPEAGVQLHLEKISALI